MLTDPLLVRNVLNGKDIEIFLNYLNSYLQLREDMDFTFLIYDSFDPTGSINNTHKYEEYNQMSESDKEIGLRRLFVPLSNFSDENKSVLAEIEF